MQGKLDESNDGERVKADIATLRNWFTNAVRAPKDADRAGGDYVARGLHGATTYIDAKSRDPGCKAFWNPPSNPDLALETWSVMPEKGRRVKTGWTLNPLSVATFILFTFDPIDFPDAILMPLPPLRAAFIRHRDPWYSSYRHATQFTFGGNWSRAGWLSECVFVPMDVVEAAVREASFTRARPALRCSFCDDPCGPSGKCNGCLSLQTNHEEG